MAEESGELEWTGRSTSAPARAVDALGVVTTEIWTHLPA